MRHQCQYRSLEGSVHCSLVHSTDFRPRLPSHLQIQDSTNKSVALSPPSKPPLAAQYEHTHGLASHQSTPPLSLLKWQGSRSPECRPAELSTRLIRSSPARSLAGVTREAAARSLRSEAGWSGLADVAYGGVGAWGPRAAMWTLLGLEGGGGCISGEWWCEGDEKGRSRKARSGIRTGLSGKGSRATERGRKRGPMPHEFCNLPLDARSSMSCVLGWVCKYRSSRHVF